MKLALRRVAKIWITAENPTSYEELKVSLVKRFSGNNIIRAITEISIMKYRTGESIMLFLDNMRAKAANCFLGFKITLAFFIIEIPENLAIMIIGKAFANSRERVYEIIARYDASKKNKNLENNEYVDNLDIDAIYKRN